MSQDDETFTVMVSSLQVGFDHERQPWIFRIQFWLVYSIKCALSFPFFLILLSLN